MTAAPHWKPFSLALCLITLVFGSAASGMEPLPISDLWKSEEFRKVFTGSYGIDSRIEPLLTVDEEEYLDDAAELMAAEDREGAIELFQGASILPESPAMMFTLANLLFEQGELEACIERFQQTVAAFPNFRDAHRNLAIALIESGEVEAAESSLIRALELGARDGLSLGLLGYCHAVDGDHQASLQAYRQARMTMPDEIQWKFGEAQALQELGGTEEAIAHYRELLKDRPEDEALWLSLAYELRETGSDQKAIAAMEVSHALQALKPMDMLMLGHLYLRAELAQESLARYQLALELGKAQEDMIAEAETTEEEDSTEAILPGLPELQHPVQALQYLTDHGDWDEALELRAAIQDAYPEAKSANLTRVSALIEFEKGDREKAVSTLEELVNTDPLDGQAILMLGRFHQSEERFGEARMLFEQASMLTDYTVDSMVSLGRLFVELGEYEEALERLERAQALDPRPSVASYLEAVRDVIPQPY